MLREAFWDRMFVASLKSSSVHTWKHKQPHEGITTRGHHKSTLQLLPSSTAAALTERHTEGVCAQSSDPDNPGMRARWNSRSYRFFTWVVQWSIYLPLKCKCCHLQRRKKQKGVEGEKEREQRREKERRIVYEGGGAGDGGVERPGYLSSVLLQSLEVEEGNVDQVTAINHRDQIRLGAHPLTLPNSHHIPNPWILREEQRCSELPH